MNGPISAKISSVSGWRCFGRRRLLFEHDRLADLAADPDKALGNLLLRSPENMRFHRSPRFDLLTLLYFTQHAHRNASPGQVAAIG